MSRKHYGEFSFGSQEPLPLPMPNKRTMKNKLDKIHWDYLFWFVFGAIVVLILIKIFNWF